MPDQEPMDLASVNEESFRPHLNSEFTIQSDDGAIPLTLTEVTEYPDHRPEGASFRKPFGLVFKCEVGVLGQGVYRLEHAALPPGEIFLSPFEGGEGWCKVEAVFN